MASFESTLRESAADPVEFGRQFQQHCLQLGKTLTVEIGSQRSTGRCAGIGPDGALLLESHDGLEKFYSGVLR